MKFKTVVLCLKLIIYLLSYNIYNCASVTNKSNLIVAQWYNYSGLKDTILR